MKFSPAIFATLMLVITLTACRKESAKVASQASGVVLFPEAGVTINVGEGWKRIDLNPGPPVCPPTLVGSAGIIRAMLFAPGINSINAAIDSVHSMVNRDPDAVKNSYRQEPFTTDSGLHGEHIFYSDQIQNNGTITVTASHNFIVQRLDGRCVAISYLATAMRDANAVQQTIEKSLKLQ